MGPWSNCSSLVFWYTGNTNHSPFPEIATLTRLSNRQFAHASGRSFSGVVNSDFVIVPRAVLNDGLQARSTLPPIAGAVTVGAVAYAVYIGKSYTRITAQKVTFHVSTGGASTQVGEVGIFSSLVGPNQSAQTLTKIVATATLDDLTGTGVKGNTTAFAQDIDANVHLWCVYRVDMASTEPTVFGLTADMSQGQILSLPAASDLTTVSTIAGALIAPLVTWMAPNLVLTYS